ncbi:MAG: T9SS type A sorting domain-containing protein [Saprospiraceae bacterium]|nr:T9SS type A sorting domain-containing protein [Saprospiraceae bacterium]
MKYKLITVFLFTMVSLTAQNEINWQNAAAVSASHFGNSHPRITCSEKGEAYMVWGRSSDQSVQFAYWNGSVFSTPVKVNVTNSASASWMGPDMASRNDTIYIVHKSVPEDDPNSHMYLIRSFDGGRNFSKPVQIESIGTDISRFPTVAIDKFGQPIVAYMRFNSKFLESRWVITSSTDYGITFQPAVLASGWGKSEEVCDCCPGSLTCVDGTCALFYRDNNNNIRDSWVSISRDNGKSFSSGFNVDNNNWNIFTCPASGPDGIILDDNIYSTFMNGKNSLSRNYLSRSSLSNDKFVDKIDLSANINNLRIQNFPRIAGYGKSLAVVGTQSVVANKVEIPMWFTNNYENGINTKYQLVDEFNISNCDITMNKNSIFVVWQDDNTRTVNFRSGSYNPTSLLDEKSNKLPVVYNTINSWLIESDFLTTLEIVDIHGRTIKTFDNIQNNNVEISKQDVAPGMHIAKIKTTSKTFYIKLL